MLAGRVDSVRLQPNWRVGPRDADLARMLEETIANGRVRDGLEDLLPPARAYRDLENPLADYRDIARRGGWATVPPIGKLAIGDHDRRVPALGRRLAASGDLEPGGASTLLFDAEPETAVRAFQSRPDLEVDGVVGPATSSAPGVTAADRAVQIAGNLERWRLRELFLPARRSRRRSPSHYTESCRRSSPYPVVVCRPMSPPRSVAVHRAAVAIGAPIEELGRLTRLQPPGRPSPSRRELEPTPGGVSAFARR